MMTGKRENRIGRYLKAFSLLKGSGNHCNHMLPMRIQW